MIRCILVTMLLGFASANFSAAAQTAVEAASQRRVALVIGNGSYRHVGRLDNPTRDAQLVASTLKELGFFLVGGVPHLDLDKPQFEAIVRQFGNAISGADIALFYYAGHGVQVRGNNWLVPVNANVARESDVEFEFVDAGAVLRQMEGARTKLNLMILDACRNNPFPSAGFRSAGTGLAQMQAPEGTLISYATQPGNVAMDGTDGNSPYTKALSAAMRKPGLGVFEVFNDVGVSVKRQSKGAQQPWVSSSPIEGKFYFVNAPAASTQSGPPIAAVTSPAPIDADALHWQSVATSNDPAQIKTYLDRYPAGKFVEIAKMKVAALTKPRETRGMEGVWQGEEGIWRITARVSGDMLEGTIQCHRKGEWSDIPQIAGIVRPDGTVEAAMTSPVKGWVHRRIEGRLPNLKVVGPGGNLTCPNGNVALRRVAPG